MEKTQAYLERSKSSPVNVSLSLYGELSPRHPFFQVIPRTTGRLKSLIMHGLPEQPNDIAGHLSNPEPLLERLELYGSFTAVPVLFSGDLSSLRHLQLCKIQTELPWRNMASLTSVDLEAVSPKISITHLLDFLESAPRLHTVRLIDTASTSGGQGSRLVSLASLKEMKIGGSTPCAPLLDHLSIPIGAKLDILPVSLDPSCENLFPRSPGNLRNISNFTTVSLWFKAAYSRTKFAGPDGELSMTSGFPQADISMALGYLVRLGPSTIERLSISGGGPPAADVVHQVLLPMQSLRTLTIYRCENTYTLIRSLSPQPQPSSVVFCPKLEELVLSLRRNEEKYAIRHVIRMAESRASRGAKLKTVQILKDRRGFDEVDVSELEKHVLRVEFGAEAANND